ncbi:GNAT family N-acetyltransferase [Xylanimonas allomyrinae]|uniref:GNAT family N-acetyltransferase n=1 Tax=Xylanimonas allomyrinae TaxID=2509459 RepID=A0A4P6EJJ4_9MICO|nr:GNAT family N-acetyltransferase [Xylanimonas allomyrinae]QAY62732.1 GNAT family N-acetyltransferase [Xylanimonas allomyrinae]
MIATVGVDLPERWASHPLVVTESAHHAWDASHAWWDDDALLLRLRRLAATEPDGYGVYGVGSPDAVARLVLAAGDLAPVGRTTVPRGTRAALARLTAAVPAPFDRPAQAHWDWLMTDRAPADLPGQERVEELTGRAGLREAAATLGVAHPEGELAVGEPRSRWWGWRDDDGVLRGVVGADRRVPGAPWVLGSVGTDPAWRRRGVAAATTAVAVRAGLAEAPIVTLGMYADNDAARRTYARVGFVVVQANESSR